MRFIFGIIIGCLLTVGGAYVFDTVLPAGAKQMVNWDVVATNLDGCDVASAIRSGSFSRLPDIRRSDGRLLS